MRFSRLVWIPVLVIAVSVIAIGANALIAGDGFFLQPNQVSAVQEGQFEMMGLQTQFYEEQMARMAVEERIADLEEVIENLPDTCAGAAELDEDRIAEIAGDVGSALSEYDEPILLQDATSQLGVCCFTCSWNIGITCSGDNARFTPGDISNRAASYPASGGGLLSFDRSTSNNKQALCNYFYAEKGDPCQFGVPGDCPQNNAKAGAHLAFAILSCHSLASQRCENGKVSSLTSMFSVSNLISIITSPLSACRNECKAPNDCPVLVSTANIASLSQ
jgi:hypothetical protein